LLEDTSGRGSDGGPRPDYERYFLAGISISYKVWISETKFILAHRKLQINATFPLKLANSDLQNWFIVASTSAGNFLTERRVFLAPMSQSGHQIGVSAAPSLTPAATPAMLKP
jgi:hypothetical protein